MSANKFRYMFIVDDDKIQLEMMKDFLTSRYLFEVKTFTTGEAALKEMHLKPEIVVLDYYLNSQNENAKNGMDMMKDFKSLSPSTNVIMISGQDNIEVAVDTLQNGAFDYIVKGQTAFQRLENTVNRLGDINELKLENKSQKRSILLLSIGIILIVLYAIYLKQIH